MKSNFSNAQFRCLHHRFHRNLRRFPDRLFCIDLCFCLCGSHIYLVAEKFITLTVHFCPDHAFLLQVELTLCHLASLMTLFNRCVYFDFFTSGGTQIRALSMNKPHFSSTLRILPSIELPWAAAILKRKNVSIIFIFTFLHLFSILKIWYCGLVIMPI